MKTHTLGSMFAGIGGIELGFENTGRFETKWQIERDKYANQVLAKHWPSVDRWKDVKTFPPRPVADWDCDVIAGGFPCQDLSFAGKGAGLEGERSGLFYEVVRVARIIRPRAIVLENVAALYVRGMDVVLGEMAEIGYNAEWHCVSAASVGAPHRRDRVFIIGYLADSNGQRLKGGIQETIYGEPSLSRKSGRSRENERGMWATEPSVDRVADGVPKRMDRLRCLGNAVVPKCAEVVANRLLEILDA